MRKSKRADPLEWSFVLRTLGWVDLESTQGLRKEARDLSRRLETRAYVFVGEHTSGCLGYDLFEAGTELEHAEWDGTLHFRSPCKRPRPKFGERFPDPLFADEGIYLPACHFQDDGLGVALCISGIEPDGVQRADFIVLKE